jgi:MFS transporter, ACS family, D-galactonate transporter
MSPAIVTTSRPSAVSRIPTPLLISLFLLAISVVLNYVDRGSLSIAAPMLKDELSISPSQLGFLLSAFFWTYACSQLLSGWLVDRLNVNWVFAAGFALWSAATALTGITHAFAVLFALRLLLGISESVAYPSYSKIIALNFSEEHRGFANSTISSGLVLGPGIGMLFGGMLMARFGWRPFFIILGGASLLWLVPWLIFMPKPTPKAQQIASTDTSAAPTLFEFLQLRSAWGTCLGLFAGNYVSYFLITWLPYYLVRERNFSMDHMAKLGGTAYLIGACTSVVCGWLSDRWIASGTTPTRVRKTFTAGGLALTGIFVGLAVVSGPLYCSAALILGLAFFGATCSNVWAITQTLAGPRAAGRWTGFQNFVANLAGAIAPALTGYVLNRTGHFYWAFVIVTAVALAGAACWLFLIGPIVPVTWHRAQRQNSTVADSA